MSTPVTAPESAAGTAAASRADAGRATPAATRQTRVLFYHPEPEGDGRARAFVAAARGLAALGWHVAVATPADAPGARPRGAGAAPSAAALAAAAGVRVVPVARGAGDAGLVAATAALSRAIRAELAEVVFVHGARGQVVGAGGAWRAGRAAVIRRVGAGEPLALGAAERAALRAAPTGFLCTTPEQAARAPARAALGSVVADLGVPERAPAAEGRGRRVRCVVGLGAELRAALALRAAAMIAPRHRDLRLALVGPGAGGEVLQLHAAALGVRHQVTFDGAPAPGLPDPDLVWVIADGDDAAFAALDAMAAGVPVLAERRSVAARYVADGITGVHLGADDVAGTAAVLARLLGHADARAAMGAAGRNRARRAHGEAAMVEGFARAAGAARDRARWRG